MEQRRAKTSLEKRKAEGHKKALDVLCAVAGAGALAAMVGGSLCGCSTFGLTGYEKLETPAEVVSIEVAGTAAVAVDDEESRYVARLANPDYAPDGMEPLDSATIAEIEDSLTSRLTVASGKTGVARAYLKSGKMVETTRVYTAKVAGEDVYVVKVFDNGAVVVLTPKEQAEQEARDVEDAAIEKALEEVNANTRYALEDVAGLKKAGLPSNCAKQLSGAFSKWCKKNKLQGINGVTGADISCDGKKYTISLYASNKENGEAAAAYNVIATWDGKKLSFAKEKGSEE